MNWTKQNEDYLVYLYHFHLAPSRGITSKSWEEMSKEMKQRMSVDVSPKDCRDKISAIIQQKNELAELIEIVMVDTLKQPLAVVDHVHDVKETFSSNEETDSDSSVNGETTSPSVPSTKANRKTEASSAKECVEITAPPDDWTDEMDAYLVYLRDLLPVHTNKRISQELWMTLLDDMLKNFPAPWLTIDRCRQRIRRLKYENDKILRGSEFASRRDFVTKEISEDSDHQKGDDHIPIEITTSNMKDSSPLLPAAKEDSRNTEEMDEDDEGDGVDEGAFGIDEEEHPISESLLTRRLPWTEEIDAHLVRFNDSIRKEQGRLKKKGVVNRIYEEMRNIFPQADWLSSERCRNRFRKLPERRKNQLRKMLPPLKINEDTFTKEEQIDHNSGVVLSKELDIEKEEVNDDDSNDDSDDGNSSKSMTEDDSSVDPYIRKRSQSNDDTIPKKRGKYIKWTDAMDLKLLTLRSSLKDEVGSLSTKAREKILKAMKETFPNVATAFSDRRLQSRMDTLRNIYRKNKKLKRSSSSKDNLQLDQAILDLYRRKAAEK